MRACCAPEVRGPRIGDRLRLAARAGLLVVALISLTAGAQQRQLVPLKSQSTLPLALSDLAGARHDLQQHAGRVVLVHFFATWCEPCREELSSLSGLAEQAGAPPLSILAVNVAEVPVRVARFLATQPVPFPVLLDADRSVTRAWGVRTLPTTFVLDRNLVPRLLAEGDLDWRRADILSAIEQVARDN